MIPGPSELIVILLIAVVVFGPKRIPEIMSSLGKGIRTFKKTMEEEEAPPARPVSESTPPELQANVSPRRELPPGEKNGIG
jgi:sec-independent protein translocase protein TatA